MMMAFFAGSQLRFNSDAVLRKRTVDTRKSKKQVICGGLGCNRIDEAACTIIIPCENIHDFMILIGQNLIKGLLPDCLVF